MTAPPGYVIYEGPSRLDYAPIVAIVTLQSHNAKTGNMPQVWFLRQDQAPTEAAANGSDESICGNCLFRPILKTQRPNEEASCYVTLIHGPNQIWKSYRRGRYPDLPRDYNFNRPVRIGSYGDPASIPLSVLRGFAGRCQAGYTAYTHQWRRYPGLKGLCMASVDNEHEQAWAAGKGFRTFRVIQEKDSHPDLINHEFAGREILCPAAEHTANGRQFALGERTTCAKCRICDGKKGATDGRAHIAVFAH